MRNRASAKVSVPPLVFLNEETGKYNWKNNLMSSKDYWLGWFTGLTQDFLTSTHPKIFMIADKLRLDKEMIIAHMSGKFKLVSFGQHTGHCMMEDDPKAFARACRDFLAKFKICMGVEDVLKQEEVGIGFFTNTVREYGK